MRACADHRTHRQPADSTIKPSTTLPSMRASDPSNDPPPCMHAPIDHSSDAHMHHTTSNYSLCSKPRNNHAIGFFRLCGCCERMREDARGCAMCAVLCADAHGCAEGVRRVCKDGARTQATACSWPDACPALAPTAGTGCAASQHSPGGQSQGPRRLVGPVSVSAT